MKASVEQCNIQDESTVEANETFIKAGDVEGLTTTHMLTSLRKLREDCIFLAFTSGEAEFLDNLRKDLKEQHPSLSILADTEIDILLTEKCEKAYPYASVTSTTPDHSVPSYTLKETVSAFRNMRKDIARELIQASLSGPSAQRTYLEGTLKPHVARNQPGPSRAQAETARVGIDLASRYSQFLGKRLSSDWHVQALRLRSMIFRLSTGRVPNPVQSVGLMNPELQKAFLKEQGWSFFKDVKAHAEAEGNMDRESTSQIMKNGMLAAKLALDRCSR